MSRTLTDEPTLGIIGCGVQAHYVLEAHRVLWPDLRCVVYDVDRDRGMAFAEAHGAMFAEAVQPARLISFALSRQLGSRWSSRFGFDLAHISMRSVLMLRVSKRSNQRCSVVREFVDDREQAAHSGEINVPLHKHAWALTSLSGTLERSLSAA